MRPNTTIAPACPEHPAIFARWEKDAAAFATRSRAGRAELGLSYGTSERQYHRPVQAGRMTAAARAVHPWRLLARTAVRTTHQPYRARTERAWRHRRASRVTISARKSRSPTSSDRLRAATLFLWTRFRKRILVYGHSAGGHLAGAMLATDWTKFDSSAPADLVPAAYVHLGRVRSHPARCRPR